jgi:ribonuclease HI
VKLFRLISSVKDQNNIFFMKESMPLVEIYTDGACSGNPGLGGWGALLIFKEKRKEISGFLDDTTNNQMEIMAAIEALKILKKPCTVNIYTDSTYVQKGITEWIYNWEKNNWRKRDNKPVKNVELWKNLQQEIKKHDIIWNWVKGHSNNEGNDIADRLAVEAREEARGKLKNVNYR